LSKGGGVPKSENILKLVEANTKNNDALQQNFDIFDVCKNKKRTSKFDLNLITNLIFQAGGCEAIAQSFQCTVNKAPGIVVGMVADSVQDISVNYFVIANWKS